MYNDESYFLYDLLTKLLIKF